MARELGFAGRFNIVFAGNMGLAQALGPVIEAARRLRNQAPDVLFTFIGGGIEVDRLKQSASDLPNVQLLPRRSPSQIGEVLSNADALLVNLKAEPLFEITIPSKIQAYLFAGRPILCGVKGDAADLVCRAGAGLPFTPEDPDVLAETVLTLRGFDAEGLRLMGNNGRVFYRKHLAMDEGVRRMEEAFESVVAVPARMLGRPKVLGRVPRAEREETSP